MEILYLEDDLEFKDALHNFFIENTAIHLNITIAQTVTEAIKIAQSNRHFDLILVDLKLTGHFNGYDFLRQVQQTGKFKDVRKIILSDLDRENITISGREISFKELHEVGMTTFASKKLLWQQDTSELVQLITGDKQYLHIDNIINPVDSLITFKSFFYLAILGFIIISIGGFARNQIIITIGTGGVMLSSILLLYSLTLPYDKSYEE